MTQMVTRCPKCATAFRITSTQLESAKGAVRCGSCLHIFKAQDYLVSAAAPTPETKAAEAPKTKELPKAKPIATPEKKAATPAPTQTQKPAAKIVIDKSKVLADEDDELISDDMDNAKSEKTGYEFDGFLDVDLTPKQTVSLFEREVRYSEPTEEKEEKIDESWAEDLLDDDDENQPQLKVSHASPAQQAKRDASNEEESSEEAFFNSTITEQHEQETPAEESDQQAPKFSFSLISETPSNEEPEYSEAFLSATRGNEEAQAPTQNADDFAANLFAENSEPESLQSPKPAVRKTPKIRGLDSRASLLMNIIPAPVELTARRMRRWYQHRIWSSAALLAAITLFFQIAYFKFDYFSRVEPYRTAYLFACPVFQCKVPSLVDKSRLQANSLRVHNNPDIKNALFVDVNLLNLADFEQPFPDLLLSFTTIDETPVAARRFTPKEYLAGELIGKTQIPSHQPVHITLEIVDPGPDAINYSLIIP